MTTDVASLNTQSHTAKGLTPLCTYFSSETQPAGHAVTMSQFLYFVHKLYLLLQLPSNFADSMPILYFSSQGLPPVHSCLSAKRKIEQ